MSTYYCNNIKIILIILYNVVIFLLLEKIGYVVGMGLISSVSFTHPARDQGKNKFVYINIYI